MTLAGGVQTLVAVGPTQMHTQDCSCWASGPTLIFGASFAPESKIWSPSPCSSEPKVTSDRLTLEPTLFFVAICAMNMMGYSQDHGSKTSSMFR